MFYQGTVVRLRVSVGAGVRSALFADAAVRFRSENENRQRFAIPHLVYLNAGGNSGAQTAAGLPEEAKIATLSTG